MAHGIDHTFRRTWDRQAFATKAAERKPEEQYGSLLLEERSIERAQAVPRSLQGVAQKRDANSIEREIALRIGQRKEVKGGLDATARDRSAFFCELCAYGCMDNMAWLEHLNSLSHLRRSGSALAPERSTVAEVMEKLAGAAATQPGRGDAAAHRHLDAAHSSDGKGLTVANVPAGAVGAAELVGAVSAVDQFDARMARRREAATAALASVRNARSVEDGIAEEAFRHLPVREGTDSSHVVAGAADIANNRSLLSDEPEDEVVPITHDDMATLMGFGSFGTSKK